MGENERLLLEKIESNNKGSRFILGIDGLSRSGKTTLVNKLSQHMKEKKILFHIFHIDDYIAQREKRYNTGNEEWYEYYNLQWDPDWLSRNFFSKLKFAHHLILPVYDDESDTHNQQEVQLSNDSVIIVEGVFLQRKEWRSFFDYVVYLDCPKSKRFLRESEDTQKNIAKFENRYWKAEEFYVKTEAPDKHADLVLKG
ncbi:kinase [Bacillus cytotoxicus]|uniref:Kinase n=1 Tax=Bacillus cytotoxicus TaxID=580165 RepID=A0ACC6A7F3_9BACI|nr:kinase [Bacillus cytotoxicus]